MVNEVTPALSTPAGRLWLSPKDLAERYGVSIVSIWRWTKAGRLPQPHRIGPNCVRYCGEEVRAHEQHLRGAA